MGIRHMRGAKRCARAYGSAQSRPRQGGTQDTAQRTQGQGPKKRVCVRYRTETCAFQKKKWREKEEGVIFGLGCRDMHNQIESSFFFPFAEVERRMDGMPFQLPGSTRKIRTSAE
jgi:hypothetical protein